MGINMTIQEKVSNLLKLRSQIDEIKKQIEPLQAQRDELQQNIIQHMKKQGFDSVKTPVATIAKSISKRLVIQDESKLVEDLKQRGLTDYVKERVNNALWMSFSREAVKQDLKLAGTEIAETEYISIRKRAEKKGGADNA